MPTSLTGATLHLDRNLANSPGSIRPREENTAALSSSLAEISTMPSISSMLSSPRSQLLLPPTHHPPSLPILTSPSSPLMDPLSQTPTPPLIIYDEIVILPSRLFHFMNSECPYRYPDGHTYVQTSRYPYTFYITERQGRGSIHIHTLTHALDTVR